MHAPPVWGVNKLLDCRCPRLDTQVLRMMICSPDDDVYYDSSVANSDSYCDSMYGTIFICCSPASQTDHPMGLYCVNGGASHEYEDAAAPTPPSTSSACVDRQVINGYELCKVELPGGCSDHEEPQAAAAEYGQSTSGMTGCRSETTGGVK